MTIAFVNGIKKLASASPAATAAANFTGANCLVALITVPTGSTLSSFVDSSGNTWTAHPNGVPKTITGTSSRGYVYTAVNATVSASQTFTATYSVTDIGYVAVAGFSGVASVSAIEGTGYLSESSGVTSHTGGSTGGQTSGDAVVACFWDDEGVSGGRNLTFTAGSGFTLPASTSSDDGRTQMTGGIEYQLGVGSGSIAATWSSSSANIGAAFILALKASGSNIAPIAANYYRRRRLSA